MSVCLWRMRYSRGFAKKQRLIDALRSIAGTYFVVRALGRNDWTSLGECNEGFGFGQENLP